MSDDDFMFNGKKFINITHDPKYQEMCKREEESAREFFSKLDVQEILADYHKLKGQDNRERILINYCYFEEDEIDKFATVIYNLDDAEYATIIACEKSTNAVKITSSFDQT